MEATRESLTERVGKATLAFVLACGLMLPTTALVAQPQQAWGDVNTTEPAYLQVNRNGDANGNSGYLGYQVFKADVTYTNGEATAQNIDWASENAKTAVLAYLATHSGNAAATYANANAAANYISDQIAADLTNNVDSDANTTPATTTGPSFATGLARALAAASPAVATTSITANSATQLAEGYWLIATDPSSLTVDDGGSAPIWIAMSANDTQATPRQVTAKEFRPSTTFQIKEDSTGTFGDKADSNRDQNLEYLVTGVLPQNFAAYSQFNDVYTVTVPAGISIANGTSGFTVNVGNTALTQNANSSGFAVAESNGAYTITLTDLRAVANAASSTNVTIAFQASLNASATTGAPGNTVTLDRTYTSNPVTLGTSAITQLSVTDYTYEIDATKVYKSNANTKLEGATFLIQANTNMPTATSGNAWYVSNTGALVEASNNAATAAANTNLVFTSAATTGAFTVPMVDQGIYTVIEKDPPTGYAAQDADIVLTLTAPSSLDGTLSSVTLTGGEAQGNTSDAVPTAAVDATSGHIVNLQITDDKIITMPLTGLPGYVGVTIIGLVLLVIGFGGIFLLRRMRNKKPLEQ